MGSVVLVTSLKHVTPFPQGYRRLMVTGRRGGLMSPYSYFDKMLTGSILCRSYASNHSNNEFVNALVVLYPDDIVLKQSSPISSSYNLFTRLFYDVPRALVERHDIDVLFKTKNSTIIYFWHLASYELLD